MSPSFTCDEPGCAAPGGGTCALGHPDPEDCPKPVLTNDPQATATDPAGRDEPSDGVPQRPAEPPGVPLAAGLALTIDEATTLAADVGARLVTPLGPVKVGKTTLMVEIYSRFLSRTEWAGCSYGWSDTLLDFELLAFPSRLAAGSGLPTTWRTRLGDERLLHLQLCTSDAPDDPTDLLFLNMSGELSERVRDGLPPNEELPLLRSTARLLICVDGERVADEARRGQAVSHTRQLVRTLAGAASLGSAARAALVLTKWDKVVHASCQEAWDQEEKELVKDMAKLGHGTNCFRIAARPELPAPPDDGMDGLLRWLIEDPHDGPPEQPAPPPPARAVGRSKA